MKMQDLTNKSRDELNQILVDLKAKILKLNFDLADNKVKDISQLKKTKKDIARVLTLLKSQNSQTLDPKSYSDSRLRTGTFDEKILNKSK